MFSQFVHCFLFLLKSSDYVTRVSKSTILYCTISSILNLLWFKMHPSLEVNVLNSNTVKAKQQQTKQATISKRKKQRIRYYNIYELNYDVSSVAGTLPNEVHLCICRLQIFFPIFSFFASCFHFVLSFFYIFFSF